MFQYKTDMVTKKPPPPPQKKKKKGIGKITVLIYL